uniref:Uncharacterized protein n=1 Tax=Cacopsylla melanoneura TaxID=428564 RepID=A0A8D8T2K3_9HEMI
MLKFKPLVVTVPSIKPLKGKRNSSTKHFFHLLEHLLKIKLISAYNYGHLQTAHIPGHVGYHPLYLYRVCRSSSSRRSTSSSRRPPSSTRPWIRHTSWWPWGSIQS